MPEYAPLLPLLVLGIRIYVGVNIRIQFVMSGVVLIIIWRAFYDSGKLQRLIIMINSFLAYYPYNISSRYSFILNYSIDKA